MHSFGMRFARLVPNKNLTRSQFQMMVYLPLLAVTK